MAAFKLKPFLTYLLSFSIAIFLLFYVFKDIDVGEMFSKLQYLDYSWILLSLFLSILSHIFRAYRWNILLKPLGFNLSLFRTFMAVMIGYFANLIIPRMGEVSRCAILKRTDAVPMASSIGTVVAERFLDFIVLMSLLTFTLIIEFSKLRDFIFSFFSSRFTGIGENLFGIYIIIGIFFLLLFFVFLFRKKISHSFAKNPLFIKVKGFLKEAGAGLLTIRKIENKRGFWLSTIYIWLLYYLMTYVVFFSLPETENLSLLAGLSILVMGGLGMSAPVQGGIGAYHALVSSVLVLYGVSETDGVLFATILHTLYTILVLIVGGICILAVSLNKRAIFSSKKVHNEVN